MSARVPIQESVACPRCGQPGRPFNFCGAVGFTHTDIGQDERCDFNGPMEGDMRTEHVERLNRAQEIEDAARALMNALKRSRQPYRQTARNAPTAEQVRNADRQRLAQAENRLRELLGGDDG